MATFISAMEEYAAQQVAAERERIKKEVEKKLSECSEAACSYRTTFNEVMHIIDSL